MSFKAGEEEVFRDGRLFTNYYRRQPSEVAEFEVRAAGTKIWTTVDARRDHAGERWTNALVLEAALECRERRVGGYDTAVRYSSVLLLALDSFKLSSVRKRLM